MYARILTKALVIVLIVMKFQCYAYGLDEALKRRFLEEYPKAQQAISRFHGAEATLQEETVKHVLGMRTVLNKDQIKTFDDAVAEALTAD